MTDIVIKSDDTPAQPKPVEEQDIKETLRKADEYEKKKAEIEKLEALYEREQAIRAKMALGGRAEAGIQEKTEEEKAKEEALELLKPYGVV